MPLVAFARFGVQVIHENVTQHCWRNGHRVIAVAEPLSNRRAGDIQIKGFQPDRRSPFRGGVGMARATRDDEGNQGEYIVSPVPTANLGEGVGADEKKQLIFGVQQFAYRVQGMNREAFPGGLFQPGSLKARFIGACQFHHGKPLLPVRGWTLRFVRGHGVGDEPYLIEIARFTGFARDREVGVVDWIESPAKQAQPHQGHPT